MRARFAKLIFKLCYAPLRVLPPAQPINRLRGAVVRLFLRSGGRNLRIYDHVSITNPQNISIGNDVVINPGCFLVASQSAITIGDDCLLAPRCFLETMNHRFLDPDTPIRLQGHDSAPITVGRDCWLAYGVVVLPGRSIGDGAVVGACSLVTRDIEPYTVNAGNPAAKIRNR